MTGLRVQGEPRPHLRERLDQPPEKPFRHLPSLDGTRGIGIVIVMAGHYSAGLSHYMGTRLFGLSLTIDLFFVLSGFLITSLLLEEWSKTGGVSMRNFYVRRGLRLLPALAVLLLAVFVVMLFGWLPWKLTLAEIAAAAFYVYPGLLLFKAEDAFLVHLWTLSVEEWFYFIWPACIVFLGIKPGTARRFRMVIGALLGLVALAFVLRVNGGNDGLSRLVYAFRPDSLAWGALLAIFMRKAPDLRLPSLDRILLWVGIIGSLGWVYFDILAVYPRPPELAGPDFDAEFHDVAWGSWNYQLGILCCVAVILHQVHRPQGVVAKALSARPLVRIGQLSYALYLWHQPVFLLAESRWYRDHREFMPTSGADGGIGAWYDDHRILFGQWVFALAVGVVSLVIAQLSWKFVEVPALRMKKRFEVVRYEGKR